MRRIAVLGALALVAVGLGATAAGGAGEAASRPSLEVQSTDPFRVRGEDFRPHEAVRVTATLDGETTVVSRRAGPRGRFWAKFPADTCTATVTARGERGSRASVSFAHVTCRPTS